jgi:hypothetical protein
VRQIVSKSPTAIEEQILSEMAGTVGFRRQSRNLRSHTGLNESRRSFSSRSMCELFFDGLQLVSQLIALPDQVVTSCEGLVHVLQRLACFREFSRF